MHSLCQSRTKKNTRLGVVLKPKVDEFIVANIVFTCPDNFGSTIARIETKSAASEMYDHILLCFTLASPISL